MFFSAFERADSIAKNILANAPAEIVDAYYHELLYVMEDDVSDEEGTDMGGETVKIEWTFDFVVSSYRSQYITYQINFNGNNIYDLYLEYDMAGLMNGCYDILWAFIYSDDDAATPDFNREKVLQALNTFSNLSVDAQTMFLLMEGENGYYYMALETFINQNFTEAAGEVALKLLTLEQNYILYAALQDAESLADLNEVYTELVEMYAALSGEDKASFADLEGIYALNIEKYEAITQ